MDATTAISLTPPHGRSVIASEQPVEQLAVRTVLAEPTEFGKSGIARSDAEQKLLKTRFPRPFTLLQRGLSIETYEEFHQATVGCLPENLVPVYCYKKDVSTSSTSCRRSRPKMLPGWLLLADKLKEKEWQRRGLFPHVTSGHIKEDGSYSKPKQKKDTAKFKQTHNEVSCSGYDPDSISCFVITSQDNLFSKNTKSTCDWVTAVKSAITIQKEAGIEPLRPFVFYHVAGGHFSRPYSFDELFPGDTLERFEAALNDWNLYIQSLGLSAGTLSKLAWRYDPKQMIDGIIETHYLVKDIDNKQLELNQRLIKLCQSSDATAGSVIALLEQGANPNAGSYPNPEESDCRFETALETLLKLVNRVGLDWLPEDIKSVVQAFSKAGLVPDKLTISRYIVLYYPEIIEHLIAQGSELELNFLRRKSISSNTDINKVDSYLRIYKHLISRGEKLDPAWEIHELFPFTITDLKAVDNAAEFFRLAFSIGVYPDKDAAEQHLEGFMDTLLEKEKEWIAELDNEYKDKWDKSGNSDNGSLMDEYFERKSRLEAHLYFKKTHLRLIKKALKEIKPLTRSHPSAPHGAKKLPEQDLAPLSKLFQRPSLTLTPERDFHADVRKILDRYYLTPANERQISLLSNCADPELTILRQHHGCDHVLRCLLIGEAVMASFTEHHEDCRKLFVDNPELKPLILMAILMHDITAETEAKEDEELHAAEAFSSLMKSNGFSPDLVDKVATALRNKNTDTVTQVAPPFVADEEQPEDIRLILRLIRMPDCIDITRVMEIPPEFPSPPGSKRPRIFDSGRLDLAGLGLTEEKQQALTRELQTLLIGAERLASLSGGETPADHRPSTPFWKEHGLLPPYQRRDIRRHWLAYDPDPLAAMHSVLDDILRLQISECAGIKVTSDLQLKQIPVPQHLDTRKKLLAAGGAKLPEIDQKVRLLKLYPPRKPLGTISQQALSSPEVKKELHLRGLMLGEARCRRIDPAICAKKIKAGEPLPTSETCGGTCDTVNTVCQVGEQKTVGKESETTLIW